MSAPAPKIAWIFNPRIYANTLFLFDAAHDIVRLNPPFYRVSFSFYRSNMIKETVGLGEQR